MSFSIVIDCFGEGHSSVEMVVYSYVTGLIDTVRIARRSQSALSSRTKSLSDVEKYLYYAIMNCPEVGGHSWCSLTHVCS
jgi:hypothetical protein